MFFSMQHLIRPRPRSITEYVSDWSDNSFSKLRGGSRPFKLENTILTYGLGVMAWTCTNNLRVVLGPCAQY